MSLASKKELAFYLWMVVYVFVALPKSSAYILLPSPKIVPVFMTLPQDFVAAPPLPLMLNYLCILQSIKSFIFAVK